MTWTKHGYRHPPCVTCKIAVEVGMRSTLKAGRCHIRGVGELCGFHYHMLVEAYNNE